MSLNNAHPTNGGEGVVIYNGEMILLYIKKVQLKFEACPEADMKGSHSGPLYLTSHRVIFRSDKGGAKLRSFAMPFHSMKAVTLEQPVFGANYLKGRCQAEPGGNLEGEVGWSLTFPSGGCIDFGKALLKAQSLASAHTRPYNAPPPYAPPAGDYFAAPPAYYIPGNREYHGFTAPVNVFPDQPPAAGVFMYEAPPPYPGIGGSSGQAPYPAGGPSGAAPNSAAAAKEAEAFGASGTTNGPTNGHSDEAPPPSYNEAAGSTTQPYQRR